MQQIMRVSGLGDKVTCVKVEYVWNFNLTPHTSTWCVLTHKGSFTCYPIWEGREHFD
jgi:hypothetical protein